MAGVQGPGENRAAAMAVEQDVFDAVVMADDRFHGEGYQEGYKEGSSLGIVEGRQYGTLRGAKIGSEIGCYRGFALAWKCLLHSGAGEKDSRKMKVVEALIALLQHFPYDDPTYDRLHEDLDRIRGKFRQFQRWVPFHFRDDEVDPPSVTACQQSCLLLQIRVLQCHTVPLP